MLGNSELKPLENDILPAHRLLQIVGRDVIKVENLKTPPVSKIIICGLGSIFFLDKRKSFSDPDCMIQKFFTTLLLLLLTLE